MISIAEVLLGTSVGLAGLLAWDDMKSLSVWPEMIAIFGFLSMLTAWAMGFPTYSLVFVVGGLVFGLVALDLLPLADGIFLVSALYLMPSVFIAAVFILVLSVVDTVYRLGNGRFVVDTPFMTEVFFSLFVTAFVGGGLNGRP